MSLSAEPSIKRVMALYSVMRSIKTDITKCLSPGPISQHVQLIHTNRLLLTADKALLVKLRKTTGYSFTSCKKALEKFNNDVKQAELWLHEQAQKEGWTKAVRLEGRRAQEGLIGQLMGEKAAVMVEVNCETDFVARNEKFQKLVGDVASAAMAHQRSRAVSHGDYVKSMLSAEDLSALRMSDGSTIADQLALAIGRLGENIAVRRAVLLGVPVEWHVGSYIHGAVPGQAGVSMGRYGALVVLQGGQGDVETTGRKLGQHIVGEAPLSLGDKDDVPCGDSETRLLPQSFLSDPSKTVSQYLTEQGARVLDFVRFQCGEGSSNVDQ
ncbi:elongation factor Ts, mitochondrial isoform X1 [Paramormyrops kingsleyae]|uniref:elongation factor Ts, mitochondrial isoform X1 n=1 Tax=Paramormyrops kingsleyae TaxID=1676925 RepID=UPI000CD63A34|nr:elongation factor Ts, mitochondrial isoform X1 [Paramormyrops kingsleyae]